MRSDYLTYVKTMDQELLGFPESCNLMDSGVYVPKEFLIEDILSTYSSDLVQGLDEPNSWGHPRLIKAIGEEYRISEDRILVTTGGSMANFLVCAGIVRRGEQVAVESPTYAPFLSTLRFLRTKILPIKRKGDRYELDLNEIEGEVRKNKTKARTRLLVLSNLHNPSGMCLDNVTLQGLATIAQKYNVYVLVDEVFHDFVGNDQKPAATLCDRFISINSFSKVYGLGALRCGWILASPEILGKIRPVVTATENAVSKVNQLISAYIFQNISKYKAHSQNLVFRNRNLIRDFAEPLLADGLITGRVPDSGCLFYPGLPYVKDVSPFLDELRQQHQVYVASGGWFGLPNHMRIAFGGKTEEVQAGLEILSRMIRSKAK